MIDVTDNNAIYYYHFDGLGSVIALTNSSGNMVERYSYDVFGEPNTTSSVGNTYMFTGRRYDSETGNYYYRARYYNPVIGRFLQADPIGYVAGLNLYTYVANNPVNLVDPTGGCEEVASDAVDNAAEIAKIISESEDLADCFIKCQKKFIKDEACNPLGGPGHMTIFGLCRIACKKADMKGELGK